MQSTISEIYELTNSKYGELIMIINGFHNYEHFKSVYDKVLNSKNITLIETLSYKHIFEKIENIKDFDIVFKRYEGIRFKYNHE